MVIVGGHFLIGPDLNTVLNEGTIKSFNMAAKLYRYAKEKGLNVSLGILINDIGAVCDVKKSCNLKFACFDRDDFEFPKE